MGHYRSEMFTDAELEEQERKWVPTKSESIEKLQKQVRDLLRRVEQLEKQHTRFK